MNPYYQDDQVTLYHGDCLEIDAWLEADVLVTDPPYGIGWKLGSNPLRSSSPHDGIANDQDTAVRDAALAAWCDDRPSIVFGSFRAPKPWDVKQTLVWKKPIDAGVVGSTTGYRSDVEPILLRGPHIRRPSSRSSVLESRSNKNSYMRLNTRVSGSMHPHAKPVPILEWLIEWTEGVVADPFAGSGSTLIAARNLGRRAIGVELEERYCELIARRLDQMCLDFGGA
ncbi:DNA-methyltransferase [Mycolicibacterium fortuitum]|uniref:DNA-methyltransferase n=1 Tax=Mycolicibacterium fortuitum TaxID=1766 RepID=UPI003AABAB2C